MSPARVPARRPAHTPVTELDQQGVYRRFDALFEFGYPLAFLRRHCLEICLQAPEGTQIVFSIIFQLFFAKTILIQLFFQLFHVKTI